MSYSFTFDASFCTGCKACQAACKDKNNLPLGVLWRRVIEVTGGTWRRQAGAWDQDVFAYNLSIACNHCLHPKCVGICPTAAYALRPDGIVLLDAEKCMGCGYCAWGCPYGAPQYNPETGTMTKCNFCFDDLEQGLPPACVAACPLRVLDYGQITPAPAAQELRLWEIPVEEHPYPLSRHSHTGPHLAIKPHAAMSTPAEKQVANLEEIRPRAPSPWAELPLILFTLLMPTAVGAYWSLLWSFPPAAPRPFLAFLLIGLCLGAGMLASLAHLGAKKNAWRALGNVRKSWLSREILFTGLFSAGWLFTALERIVWQHNTAEAMAVTAVLGLGLVHSMSRVYRLPAIPLWNTSRTNAVFMMSALLLGHSFLAVLVPGGPKAVGILILVLLVGQLLLMDKSLALSPLPRIRILLLSAALLLTAAHLFLPAAWLGVLILVAIVFEEALGRWLFYRAAEGSFYPSLLPAPSSAQAAAPNLHFPKSGD